MLHVTGVPKVRVNVASDLGTPPKWIVVISRTNISSPINDVANRAKVIASIVEGLIAALHALFVVPLERDPCCRVTFLGDLGANPKKAPIARNRSIRRLL